MSIHKSLNIDDSLRNKDMLVFGNRKPGTFRTKIIGGYDSYVDKQGVTRLGETVFETENMIVLSGSLFTLEKVFGCPTNELDSETLNTMMGVATAGADEKSLIHSEAGAPSYLMADETVCLFGVGIGGAGESFTDVENVNYPERLVFDMIPLRQININEELTDSESQKYWFKRRESIAALGGIEKDCYYLKSFESAPTIKVLYESNEGDEDGAAVQKADIYPKYDNIVEEAQQVEPIETFVEIVFKVSKKDVREYFIDNGSIEQTRINTIGLFSGIKANTTDAAGQTVYDYKRVRMFSKLNINNEMLTLPKDLTVVYRIYTS